MSAAADEPRANDEAIAPRRLTHAPVSPPPALAPRRRVLEGRFARLEPLNPAAHGDALWRAGCAAPEHAAIWRYLPYGPFESRAAFEAHLRAQSAALDPIFYAICETASGEAAGVASYLEISPSQGAIEIGHIWLGTRIQRGPVGSEALILMMAEAMSALGNRRLQWKCDALNEKSRAAARRLGFRFEGVLCHHRLVKGRNRDTAYYSVLDAEWPGVSAVLQRWLSGVGDDGRSTASLSEMMSAHHAD